MRYFIALSALLFVICAQAQTSNFEKAKKAYGTGNLKAANKLTDKCLEHAETKNDAAVLLLKSKIMFDISKDYSLSEKYPGANKEALKYAEKAMETHKESKSALAFRNANLDYLQLLVRSNNKEAMEALGQKKFAKALPLFKKSMYFGLDTMSIVYTAECYWNLEERSESIPLYKKAADMIYPAVLDSNTKVKGYHKEPFRKLCLYYISKNDFDSAYLIVKNGREILPNDPVLNEYTYRLMRYVLEKIPPSTDYLSTVQNALVDFPSDSFLNHRENSIYIYLLNGLAEANEMTQFDTLLMQYARSKAAKTNMKQYSTVKKFDIFAGMGQAEFIEEIKNYFSLIGLKASAYAAWLIENRHRSGTYLPLEKDYLQLAFRREKYARTVYFICERHLELNKRDLKFSGERAAYVSTRNAGMASVNYIDLLPLIRMNDAAATDYPKNTGYTVAAKTLRLRLISESSDSADFNLCRQVWHESTRYKDLQTQLDLLWRKQVEQDFRLNYYGSRVNAKGKSEKGVPEYVWNGNADSCKWGKMPEDIVLRVENRINYFRRNAGLEETITLSNQDNENCMYAALMCEANKSMSHEPSDGWRCFIPEGLEALKTSILSKDGNPSIAVTAAMGQNHPSAGNRRWLLYPKAQYMGIGTSNSYTAIRAVDQSRELDTLKYKNKAVAWPPAGVCPRMLVFKKWSFSLDRNLSGATVSMSDRKGNSIVLKQEQTVNGYGLNTLVWEPEINVQTLEADEAFTVNVVLKDGSSFKYTVKIIDVALK